MGSGTRQKKPTVLVIEPEPLLRWSLTTYLGRSFSVYAVQSVNEVRAAVRVGSVDAVVLSGDLADEAEALCGLIRRSNPSLAVVRMVSNASDDSVTPGVVPIEKPFGLQALADLLWRSLPDVSEDQYQGKNRLAGL